MRLSINDSLSSETTLSDEDSDACTRLMGIFVIGLYEKAGARAGFFMAIAAFLQLPVSYALWCEDFEGTLKRLERQSFKAFYQIKKAYNFTQ